MMNCKSFIDLLTEKWSIMRCLWGAFALTNLFPKYYQDSKVISYYEV